jgi:hypothetical protein
VSWPSLVFPDVRLEKHDINIVHARALTWRVTKLDYRCEDIKTKRKLANSEAILVLLARAALRSSHPNFPITPRIQPVQPEKALQVYFSVMV